eukprot:TRINITY_DN2760_c0_g1_i1.p1 TRINITY_DN2760_c0_g1~~TRINITY_DN2760_c0_g1_i1.p1  ORF type:complete len:995 (+),score=207.63 TRINITY_DN2760_c0_g1_i1:139-3123(+)
MGGLMKSSAHLCAEEKDCESTYRFISQAFNEPEGQCKKYLEQNYAHELSLLLAARSKETEALKLSTAALKKQSKMWFQHGNTPSVEAMYQLQKLSELTLYLDRTKDVKGIEKLWHENQPDQGTDLVEWDNILTTRRMLLNLGSDEDSLKRSLATNYGYLARIAVAYRNSSYAERGLKTMNKLCRDVDMMATRRSIISKVAVMKSIDKDDSKAVQNFCNVFRSLPGETKMKNQLLPDAKDIFECLFRIADKNSSLLPSEIRKYLLQKPTEVEKFDKIFSTLDNTNGELVDFLQKEVLTFFSHAYQGEENRIADDMMEGSNFVHRLYKQNADATEFAALSVKYHLKAMECGSMISRQLFPRCLNLIKNVTECQDDFFLECQTVPAWMFLPWRNQLMSCLVSDELNSTISPLITRMVDEYPHAMAYSILVHVNTGHELSSEALITLRELKSKCKGYQDVQNIVHHMQYLSHPASLLKALNEDLRIILTEFPQQAKQKAEQRYKEFNDVYFNRRVKLGALFSKFSDEQRISIEKSIKNLNKHELEKLAAIATKVETKIAKSYALKDLSPYLSDYLAAGMSAQIEIPGQYSGFARPIPGNNVYISSFDSSVSVFFSLKKPMRIAMLGSDGKKYNFIVKTGEDIRLDQRIENLFEICNVCSRQTIDSAAESLQIQTYSVIPLSDKQGLIEFVPNTSPLLDFIKVGGKSTSDVDKAHDLLYKGLEQLTNTKANVNKTFKEAGRVKREPIIANYQKALKSTERDHLRGSLVKLSAGLKEFYLMRKNFVTSYAVVSAMQWILGIGDRHLSNYLICKKSGRIIPIDFGMSFGIATTMLAIPELVQLRLTPQILAVMDPCHTEGLFRETMIKVLRSLRDNSELLMVTLDIFVQEPTLDWLRAASKSAKNQDTTSALEDFAEQRVAWSKDKLEGGHPSSLMVKELQAGNFDNNVKKNLTQCILGDRLQQDSKDCDLTSVEQVDVLISQSRDPNLLGRMYLGWRSLA